MNNRKSAGLVIAVILFAVAACGRGSEPRAAAGELDESASDAQGTGAFERRAAPAGAAVAFVKPLDGAVVSSPVRVEFRVSGMLIAPAGQDTPDAGHHHILIDTVLPDADTPVPADANHVHFDDGSAGGDLVLPPGRHTLQLLFADHRHVPHDVAVYSEAITITVE